MARIIGKPLAHVGAVGDDGCASPQKAVPEPCTLCRQVERWMPRTVAWATTTTSRFKNIIRTILTGHDEVLKSLCGFCAQQTTQSCECFTQQYVSLGLPLTVKTSVENACLVVYEQLTSPSLCPESDLPSCWVKECGTICATCEMVTFTPCDDPDHFSIMLRAYQAEILRFGKRGTGPNIIASLEVLFPASTPQIVKVELGMVYISLSRAITPLERKYLTFLKSLVPLGLLVDLMFLTPCPVEE
jgi:hypothetical protein